MPSDIPMFSRFPFALFFDPYAPTLTFDVPDLPGVTVAVIDGGVHEESAFATGCHRRHIAAHWRWTDTVLAVAGGLPASMPVANLGSFVRRMVTMWAVGVVEARTSLAYLPDGQPAGWELTAYRHQPRFHHLDAQLDCTTTGCRTTTSRGSASKSATASKLIPHSCV